MFSFFFFLHSNNLIQRTELSLPVHPNPCSGRITEYGFDQCVEEVHLHSINKPQSRAFGSFFFSLPNVLPFLGLDILT